MNSYVFASVVEKYKSKGKDSEINTAPSCLGNILKDLSTYNVKRTGLYRLYLWFFSWLWWLWNWWYFGYS